MKRQWEIKSKIGSLFLVISDKGLCGAYWQKREIPFANSLSNSRHLQQAVGEFTEYLDGERKEFTVPLDTEGTPFQKRVWAELRKIPYGQTCSYGELAKKVGIPKAFRAVGTANGRNPVSIIVPCHRVIASDGTLGGYAGGLEIKRQLLKLERP